MVLGRGYVHHLGAKKMKVAATHTGTCQICGSEQKLPNGRLSLHGYTKQWGFFQGTCPGSRGLPYEISCDLLPSRLDWARESIKVVEGVIDQLRKPTQSAKAWVSAQSHTYGKHESQWIEAELYKTADGGAWFNDASGKAHRFMVRGQSLASMSPVDLATYANGKRADSLGGELAQLKSYEAWCLSRIEDWQVRPLNPVKP